MRPLLLPIALAAALPGCGGQACTLVGCAPCLTIQFPPVGGPGTYVFRIEEGERSWSCATSIPLPEAGAYAPCELQPMGPAVTAPETFAFTTLRLNAGHPRRARLVIERDGEVLLDRAIEPVYRTSQPNGPECAPTCSTAAVDLDG